MRRGDVYFTETDKSFIPKEVPQLGGACVIGQFLYGPAFVPMAFNSYNEFTPIFGNTDPEYFATFVARNYLNKNAPLTAIRVLGKEGYTVSTNGEIPIFVSSGSTTQSAMVLHPSRKFLENTGSFSSIYSASISGSVTDFTFDYQFSGSSGLSSEYSVEHLSLDDTSPNFVGKVFGLDAKNLNSYFYVYVSYLDFISNVENPAIYSIMSSSLGDGYYCLVDTGTSQIANNSEVVDYTSQYSTPETTLIMSQDFGSGSQSLRYDLFKFYTISDGESANTLLKTEISNIKYVDYETRPTFDVLIRSFGDTDASKNVYERWSSVNLDPDSTNFIGKIIGDKYSYFDSSGKIRTEGDYKIQSQFVRVELSDAVKNKTIPIDAIPFGFYGYSSVSYNFDDGTQSATGSEPDFEYRTQSQVYDSWTGGLSGQSSKKVCYGTIFKNDLFYHLKKKPEVATASLMEDFHMEDCYTDGTSSITINTDKKYLKFCLPLAGGFDGTHPVKRANVFDSTGKFDMSSSTSSGTVAFTSSCDILKNRDEVTSQLLFIPEANQSQVTGYALDVVEDRGDMLYIVELGTSSGSLATIISTAEDWDSSYATTFYPWIKEHCFQTQKDFWAPPSVGMAEVFGFSDYVSEVWYEAWGLNRGLIGTANDVYDILTEDEMDDAIDGKVNPFRVFNNGGIYAWGGLTLQERWSKLSNCGVRRLLIFAKVAIRNVVLYLVAEPGSSDFFDRITALVNPILEPMREKNGLKQFAIVETTTNNERDRNEFNGDIILDPTTAVGEINLGFVVTKSGGISFSD